jgi:urease accessory protein
MERETEHMRSPHPFVFTNLKTGDGVAEIVDFVVSRGGL